VTGSPATTIHPIVTTRVPSTLHTARLLMRSWDPADAPALLPLLTANIERLGGWIPAQVAEPVPLPALAERLAGFAADFGADRSYRYALLTSDGARLLGEADLFPRAAGGRVPLGDADRAEIGYWLDAAATGRGLATEATRALLGVAETLGVMRHAEIHCDVANTSSAAIPRRLGFELATVAEGTQVWRKALADRRDP
jgi:RimJ/RimL family protein N-acetyltransferase